MRRVLQIEIIINAGHDVRQSDRQNNYLFQLNAQPWKFISYNLWLANSLNHRNLKFKLEKYSRIKRYAQLSIYSFFNPFLNVWSLAWFGTEYESRGDLCWLPWVVQEKGSNINRKISFEHFKY